MDISITTQDGQIPGVIEMPAGQGPWPGVVVVHDAAGFRADTRNITRRIADNGFLAVAPDLYSRGRLGQCMRAVIRDMLVGDGDAVADILGARTYLADRADCTGRIGVVGFCLGGGFALVVASQGFGAAAPFYPSIPPTYAELLDGACPVVASFGRRDPLNIGNAERLRTEAARRGIPHDIKVYRGAGHSFANDLPGEPIMRVLGFGKNLEATEDAFDRVYTFFRNHLIDGAG
ncbi:MAG: dienelactone hydrolase family protein [Gordonia sp. (in: high G+C Gram-positive bacteria)]